MKQNINLGAYGWRQKHWLNTFYPDDLPVGADDDVVDSSTDDWRLTYYSNEFNTVLVPADYWQAGRINDCEDWLSSVHTDFQFFVECNHSMFDAFSLAELTTAIKGLLPQLSALVVVDGDQQISDTVSNQFIALADSLTVEVIGAVSGSAIWSETRSAPRSGAHEIWRSNKRSDSMHEKSQQSRFALFKDDLTDLRSARAAIELFIAQIDENGGSQAEATIIVDHPQLQAGNLNKFRSVLNIMGY